MIEKTGALSGVLLHLRTLVRMSQSDLAKSSGVSVGTVRDIEGGVTVSKPATLRKLASALAHDPLGEKSDEERIETVYERLLVAARHIPARTSDSKTQTASEPPPAAVPVDDLSDEEVIDELERRIGNREVAVSLLAAANNWRSLDPRSKRMVLETVRFAAGEDDEPPSSPSHGR